MVARHFLSIEDLSDADLLRILTRSLEIASGVPQQRSSLAGKSVGIYFKKTSTRTRTAFAIGAAKLGAISINYGPDDLQTNTGESLEDTARVLSGYLDALVVRTAGTLSEMVALSQQREMAIINAMSENEHPTQAVADLSALMEHFGRLEGLHLLYIGEGNNTAAALALALSRIAGAKLTLICPTGYGLPSSILAKSQVFAATSGAEIHESHRLTELPELVDVVYTTRWQTTGSSKTDSQWKQIFRPFCVTTELLKRVSKPVGTIFMHDLPAVRGEEVDTEVLEGPSSIAFRQANHKLFSAMAILEHCVLGRTAYQHCAPAQRVSINCH